VAAQSEPRSTFPTISEGLSKAEASPAVAMVGMGEASSASEAPVLMRHVPAVGAVVGDSVSPWQTYSLAMTAGMATMAAVVVADLRMVEMAATVDSVAAAVPAGLVYWVALMAAMEVSEVAGEERQTGALLAPRTPEMGECSEEMRIHALAAVAQAWAEQFLMTAGVWS
jgi:hypothetical protein